MTYLARTRRTPLKRRAVAVVIVLGIHAAAVALLASAGYKLPIQIQQTPVEVVFIDGVEKPQPVPDRVAPQLERPALVDLTLPVVDLPAAESAAPTAISVSAPPPPAPAPVVATGQAPVVVAKVDYLEPLATRYPPLAKRAHLEGTVVLSVLIDTEGRPSEVTIKHSSGHKELDAAGREAVLAARFRPWTENGVPRRAIATIPIEFSLAIRTASR